MLDALASHGCDVAKPSLRAPRHLDKLERPCLPDAEGLTVALCEAQHVTLRRYNACMRTNGFENLMRLFTPDSSHDSIAPCGAGRILGLVHVLFDWEQASIQRAAARLI